LLFSLSIFLIASESTAQDLAANPTWIWYPGDFDIWLSNEVQAKRIRRDIILPPWWRVYSPNNSVSFGKQVDLKGPEQIMVAVEGKYNVTIDGKYLQGENLCQKALNWLHYLGFM